MKHMNIYWGEMHDNTHQAEDPGFSMDRRLSAARSHLDFYCGAYYPSTSPAFKKGGHPSQDKGRQPLNVEAWKPPEQIAAEWAIVKEAIGRFQEDRRFVAFPGYEWQGDGTWGDHNVFFHEPDPPLFRVDTLRELYDKLRDRKAIAIPHHTAYIRGFRGKDWQMHDPEISPFMEIYSIHGSSEGDRFGGGLRSNPFLGPDDGGGSYTAAILKGHRIGIVASTDNWGALPGHYGRGLAAVLAPELTRDALWEAFLARRVYGVTGDRIGLRFACDGAPMGSVLPAGQGKRTFEAEVDGLDEIDYVELVRDEQVIDRHSPLYRFSSRPGEAREFLFRLEFGWGPGANVLELPPKAWTGDLDLEGGEFLGMIPCWISGDNQFHYQGRSARFSARTGQDTIGEAPQNGYVFKVRAKEGTVVTMDVDGQRLRTSLADLIRGGRVLWNREASAALIRESFSVDPESLSRKDVLFGMAYKAKIHRALPAEASRCRCSFSDDPGDDSPHSYRLRVLQKNGQRAWSSPIWCG